MVPSSHIPKVLADRYELQTELYNTEEILIKLKNSSKNIDQEIAFIEETIVTIKRQIESTDNEVSQILDRLKQNNEAWLLASLHYDVGCSWDEIGKMMKKDGNTLRMKVSRAIKAEFS